MRTAYLPLTMMLITACVPQDGTYKPLPKVTAMQHRYAAGRKIYNFRCYYCHGYSGNAKTVASQYLHPKPVNFTAVSARELSRKKMINTVRNGITGTAMSAYKGLLTKTEIQQVVDFVRHEFMQAHNKNTRYHTTTNGWFKQQRYANAFPFVRGAIPVDTAWSQLTASQRSGKRLFMSACISCHEGRHTTNDTPRWQPLAVSYPRNHTSFDVLTGASVYARHDVAPYIRNLTAQQKQGERLYQHNCAFCHGADGSGRNWIGSFLEPHPRDLTTLSGITQHGLEQVIHDGLANTTMPSWKNVLANNQIEAVAAYVRRAFQIRQARKPP